MSQRVYSRAAKHAAWLLAQPGVHGASPEGKYVKIFVDRIITQATKNEIVAKFGAIPVHFQETPGFQAELASPVPVEIRRKFWQMKTGIDDVAMYEGDGFGREAESDIYVRRYCITPEQKKWMDDHNLTLERMCCGGYRVCDEKTVMGFYRDWNAKLGVDWYSTEEIGQSLMDAVEHSFGCEVRFE